MYRLEQILFAIGKGSSRTGIVSSAILALVTFFYAYTISSFMKLQVFILRDRVVYDDLFDQYIFGNLVDSILISVGLLIWLYISLPMSRAGNIVALSYVGILIAAVVIGPPFIEIFSVTVFPAILLLFIYQKFFAKGNISHITVSRTLYLTYLSLIFIVISMMSIIMSLLPMISPELNSNISRNYPYEIVVMLSPFSAMLMVLLVFAVPLKLIIHEMLVTFPNLFKKIAINANHDELILSTYNGSKHKRTALILLPILALSSGLSIIPYQPAFNEDDSIVGVDTNQYALWVNSLIERYDDGFAEFLRELFTVQNGDRPLSLFLIFVAADLAQVNSLDLGQFIDYSPVLLAPLLVLSVYFLTRQLTPNYITPFLAAFLTTISFQVLAGVFAGFYANWIALITGYFSIGYLFKFLRDPKGSKLVIFGALLVSCLFAHVYTWTIISLCIGAFLILLTLLKRRDYSRKAIIIALIVLAISALIDISRALATSSPSGIYQNLQLTGSLVGPSEFDERWEILRFVVNSSLAGILGNSVIILLGLYWVWKSNIREASTLFLFVFLSVAIIPLFFGDWVLQSRTLYMIPFQIPASIGLSFMLLRGRSRKKECRSANQESTPTLSVTSSINVVAICTLLTAIAVYVLSNLYLVLPS